MFGVIAWLPPVAVTQRRLMSSVIKIRMFGRCFDAAGCAAFVIGEVPKIAVSSTEVVKRLRGHGMGIGITELWGLVF